MYLYAKDPYKVKYQFLIKKIQVKHFNDSKAFTEYSIRMIFTKILKNTIQIKNEKIFIVFDNMISDILSNKNS